MTGQGLQRLIYASRWTERLGADTDAAVQAIVTRSIQANRDADVSGLLLVHDGWFVQVLEGDAPALDRIFARVARDPRHTDVRVIDRINVFGRAFCDWAMCAVRMRPGLDPMLIELGMTRRFDGHALDPDSALRLLAEAGRIEAEAERRAWVRKAA